MEKITFKPRNLIMNPEKVYITSGYGMRPSGFHYGYDFGSNYKPAEIYCPEPCVCVVAGLSSSKNTGNRIFLYDEKNKLYFFFCHLSKIYIKKDDFVFPNTLIAMSGDTGCEGKGIHLHLEIRKAINISKTAIELHPDYLANYSTK